MRRALELAAMAMNHATPNPRVGCVLVRDGAIIAEGFTQRPGEPHAEAHAIKNARGRCHSPSDWDLPSRRKHGSRLH